MDHRIYIKNVFCNFLRVLTMETLELYTKKTDFNAISKKM